MPVPPDLERRLRDCRDRGEQIEKDRWQHAQEREHLVIEAWKAGGGIREIGELVGMSHVGVSKLLQRTGTREPWGPDTTPEDINRELDGER